MERMGKIKKQVAEYFGCKTSEVITRYPLENSNKTSDKYRIVLGNAHFEDDDAIENNNLQFVLGHVFVRSNMIRTLNHIQFIGGNLDIDRSRNFESVGDLKYIKGNLDIGCHLPKNIYSDKFPIVDGYIFDIGKIIEREQCHLNATDIGKMGFGASVDDCDSLQKYIDSQIAEKIYEIVD